MCQAADWQSQTRKIIIIIFLVWRYSCCQCGLLPIKHTSLCNIFKSVTGLHFNILSYTNPSLDCLLGIKTKVMKGHFCDLLMINGAYSETKG